MRRARVIGLGAILAAYAALHARAIDYAFVWDDVASIRDSTQYDRPLSAGLRRTEIARMDESLLALQGIEFNHESYRPLIFLSHALDIGFFGRQARPMHVHNLLLGAVAVLVSFWLARHLLGSDPAALGVAALCAVHPIHVEPVVYVSARADLLAGLLAMLSAVAVTASEDPAGTPGTRTRRALTAAAAAILFLASLLAKEASLALPLALLALGAALARLRAWRAAIAAQVATLLVYFTLRRLLVAEGPSMVASSGLRDAVVELPGLVLQYLGSFLLPLGLSIERGFRPDLILPGWVAIAVAPALSALGERRLPPDTRPGMRLAWAGLAASALLVGPAVVGVRSMGAVADRYAYLPLVAFALALAALGRLVWYRAPRLRRPLAAAAGAWFCLLGAITWIQAGVWRDNLSLYTHAVRMEPGSSMAHYRIGYLLSASGRFADSIPVYQEALRLDPRNPRALNNLAVAYLNTGRPAVAQRGLEASLRDEPYNFRGWYNLGTAHRMQGRMDRACEAWRRALSISPAYRKAMDDVARLCPGQPAASPPSGGVR